MPIDHSDEWGERVSARDDLPSFPGERALSAVLSDDGPTEIRLTGGDFVAVTGGPSTDQHVQRRYPCDALETTAKVGSWWSIGTVELRRRRWRLFGGFLVATNLGRRGDERYSSRSHPNDARFEVLDALEGLSFRDRLVLSRRISEGAPVDHPRIRTSRVTSFASPGPVHVFVDGVRVGRMSVEVRIHPDFLHVHV